MDILLVDDEDQILRVVGDFLRDFGYGVIPAANGEEALRCLQEKPEIGMMISDIRMPGIDGFELLQTVNGRFSNVPTILITGHREDNNLLKALRSGAYDYLKKPIRLKSLLSSIDQIEASKRLRERLLSDRRSMAEQDGEHSAKAGLVYEIQAPLFSAAENLQRLGIFWKAVRNDWGTLAAETHPGERSRDTVQGEVTELLGAIRNNLVSIDSILRDVGVLAQNQECAHQEVNLVGCLKEAAETTWASLPEGVRLTEAYDDEVMKVLGDRQDLCHLFSHLFSNASMAVGQDKGARIEVRAFDESAKWVRVEVTDNGAGIPEALRDRVFDPFFTTRREGDGLGLGLPVCRTISRKYGGELGFESNGGGGTTFWVRLRPARVDSSS